MEDLLAVENIDLYFGGNQALNGVSFAVPTGAVVGLIGPNGAGKSSLLNCINGFYRPRGGSIRFRGEDILTKKPYEIAAAGIARTFQNVELFAESSALDNIMLGRHLHFRTNIFAAAVRIGAGRAEEMRHRLRVEEVMKFLEIEKLRRVPVGMLSYGQQKMVEIGRALALDPQLLMYDEPTSGMNREEKEDVARFIIRMKHDLGLTQVLIEHDTRFVRELCDQLVVLDFGRVVASGPPDEVLNNPKVIEAYVGVTPTNAAG